MSENGCEVIVCGPVDGRSTSTFAFASGLVEVVVVEGVVVGMEGEVPEGVDVDEVRAFAIEMHA